MVVANTGVTFLAVLPAPVGVVIVIADQIVSFLRRRLLRTAFGRSAQQGQRQTMTLAELLLDSGEITESVVIDAIDIGVAALTGRNRKGIRPAVVLMARSIGDHRAETVHRVAVYEARTQALTHLRRTRHDIGRTADAAQTGVRRHDARRNFLIAGSVVQTAPQRPRRIARHGVVELNAVHIHVLILRIVTADVETHFAELVGRDVIEEVFRSRERRGQSLRVVGGFGVELREDRVVDHLTLRIGHEDHRIDVAHLRTDTYGDIRSLEFGSFELQRIFARRNIFENEVTLRIRNRCRTARRHRNLHVAECNASRTRNDPALDAAVLSKGGQRHKRQH